MRSRPVRVISNCVPCGSRRLALIGLCMVGQLVCLALTEVGWARPPVPPVADGQVACLHVPGAGAGSHALPGAPRAAGSGNAVTTPAGAAHDLFSGNLAGVASDRLVARDWLSVPLQPATATPDAPATPSLPTTEVPATATGTASAPVATQAPATPSSTSPAPTATTARSTPAASETARPGVTPTASLSNEAVEGTPAKGVRREERPIVVVRDFRVEPEKPAAGSTFSLVLVLQNVGERFAENVRLSLSSSAFLPASVGAMPFVNHLRPGEAAELRLPLRVAAGTADGPQALTIEVGWDDSYGGTYSDKTTIGIEVSGSANRPLLAISAVRLPARVSPGNPFELQVDVVNTGGREARNVTLVLSGPPLAPMAGGPGSPIRIPSGGSAQLAVRVVAAPPGQPGAAAQALEVRYDGPDGQRYSETQSVGLVITGNAAAAPLPVVDSYQVEPEELHPGEVFRLKLTIANLGTADAQQLRLVIGGEGGASGSAVGASGGATTASAAFAPLGAGNVRFLGRLAADQVRSVEQPMVVANSTKPGVQTLTVGFVYLDAFGEVVRDSQAITLLVSRRVRLQINPVDVVTQTVVGEMLPLTFEVVNLGSEEVNVTTAEVEPGRYMKREGGVEYLGALSSGAPYPVSATLWPQAPTKDAPVRLVVRYLDDFGREQSIAKELHFVVEERPAVEPGELTAARPPRSLAVRIVLGLLGLGASPSGSSDLEPVPGKAPLGKELVPPAGGASQSAPEEVPAVPLATPPPANEAPAVPVATAPPARSSAP